MRKLAIVLFAFQTLFCSAQETVAESETIIKENPAGKSVLDIGFMVGGGGLIGADLEFLVAPKVGLQIGLGLESFSGGIHYHLKPRINSSSLSVQYWKQGFGNNYYASYVGPIFTFRPRKIFRASLGLGYIVDEGNGIREFFEEKNARTSMVLLYSIGFYFHL